MNFFLLGLMMIGLKIRRHSEKTFLHQCLKGMKCDENSLLTRMKYDILDRFMP